MDEVNKFIKQHRPHFVLVPGESAKVQCLLNGHAFPTKGGLAELRAFVAGKKYAKLLAAKSEAAELAKLEPFLVRSKNFGDRLYCTLTGMLVAKTVAGAHKHMQGRRFTAAKARFVADEQELLPEPDLEDDEGEGEDGEGVWEEEGDEEMEGMWLPEEAIERGGRDGHGPSRGGGQGEGRSAGAEEGDGGAAGSASDAEAMEVDGADGRRGGRRGGLRETRAGDGGEGGGAGQAGRPNSKRVRPTRQPKKKVRRGE